MPRDPLAMTQVVYGQVPVWKVNLGDIQPVAYLPAGGPPSHFAETPTKDLLLYTLSSRPGGRHWATLADPGGNEFDVIAG
jgi:homogentisate 1,2-dioxygenase